MSSILKVILDKVEKNSYNIYRDRGGLMFLGLALPYIIGIISLIVILMIVIICVVVLIMKKKGKTPRIKVDDEFIFGLIENYGGKENIQNVSIDNARLKIAVEDLDKVNLPALKEISQTGVFITGNIIKTLFKYDSKLIKSTLDKIL